MSNSWQVIGSRVLVVGAATLAFVLLLFASFMAGRYLARPGVAAPPQSSSAQSSLAAPSRPAKFDGRPTAVEAHNLLLRKGPNFRVYVRWLRGTMARARRNTNPSFDDPDSFYLDINSGVLRANIGDLANFLNAGVTNSPLRNIKLSGNGDQIKLSGTLKKGISVPVELTGTIGAAPDNRIHVHITKLNVVKLPLKGLLGLFHVSLSDLFKDPHIPGLEITSNDLYFDTQQLLPPPHIRGKLTKVSVVNPDLEEVYGEGQEASHKVEEWRNFLSLNEGTIDFGKLTMHQVDLIMIDISDDPWFDLDLSNYQAQLVNGFTRITPAAGMQIFMPDVRDLPKLRPAANSSIQWFKNRNIPPPPGIVKH